MNTIQTSFFSNQALDWAKEAYSYVKPAAIRTFAPVSCALSALSCLVHFSPELICDERDDSHAKDIIIRKEADLEEAKKMYLEKAFIFDESIGDKTLFLDTVKQVLDYSLLFNYQTVEEYNNLFQTEAKLCYTLESQTSPYSTLGGTKSYSDPLILVAMPTFKISSNSAMESVRKSFLLANEMFNPEEKKFVLSHEFVHIKHNDNLVLSTLKFATSVLNILAWYTTESSSWASYLALGALKAFGIELASEVALSIYSRSIEIRSDEEAMDFLNTNEGALAFFKKISILPEKHDHLHPSIQKRIRNAQLWKSNSKAA